MSTCFKNIERNDQIKFKYLISHDVQSITLKHESFWALKIWAHLERITFWVREACGDRRVQAHLEDGITAGSCLCLQMCACAVLGVDVQFHCGIIRHARNSCPLSGCFSAIL